MDTILYPETFEYDQIKLRFDDDKRILWIYLDPEGISCFSKALLLDMRKQHNNLLTNKGYFLYKRRLRRIHFQVITSSGERPYSLGGDLNLFINCIKNRDHQTLLDYARLCVDVLYPTVINFNSTLTTIALVRGQALGGGFESALSSSVLIAEKSAKLGLPEVIFNLFPGMGAYHFLARRLPLAEVERLIMSGRLFTAEELYDMGVVDLVAEDGDGEAAVHEYINRYKNCQNTQLAIQKVRQSYRPITYADLMQVCRIWVEAALQLGQRDLRLMEKLAKAQYRISNINLAGEKRKAMGGT